jgi:hypothetical protein
MAQRVDWLVSGDDGEESFMRRWEKEVRPSWQNDERIRGDADARKQTGALSPSDDAACSENQPE